MKTKVGVSKRHVHLTKETYEKLFGNKELEIRNFLVQPGQFASTETVDIVWNDNKLEKLRIVGPFRNYDQVEIALSDANELSVNPPRRRSGDLVDSHPITLIGPNGEINLSEGLILVDKHIHFSKAEAEDLNISEGDVLEIIKDNKIITTVKAKVEEVGVIEIHIDSDEALEFNLETSEEVEVKICES